MDEKKNIVLILDDEPSIRDSLSDFFEDQGFDIIKSTSGEEALELIERIQPDAAIVDIRLPGMNGETFIQKASEKYPSMVFVICTGSPEYHSPNNTIELPGGVRHVFPKPVDQLSEMEITIRRLIQEKRRSFHE